MVESLPRDSHLSRGINSENNYYNIRIIRKTKIISRFSLPVVHSLYIVLTQQSFPVVNGTSTPRVHTDRGQMDEFRGLLVILVVDGGQYRPSGPR